jgi:hypothetical protein
MAGSNAEVDFGRFTEMTFRDVICGDAMRLEGNEVNGVGAGQLAAEHIRVLGKAGARGVFSGRLSSNSSSSLRSSYRDAKRTRWNRAPSFIW